MCVQVPVRPNGIGFPCAEITGDCEPLDCCGTMVLYFLSLVF